MEWYGTGKDPISEEEIVKSTVDYLASVWEEGLQPLIHLPLPGEVNHVEPYDFEFPLESCLGDGIDTLSVRGAVIDTLGDIQLAESRIIELSKRVVQQINRLVMQDPREPSTADLKDRLLHEYLENEDTVSYICEQSLPLKVDTYLHPDNEENRRFIHREIDDILQKADALLRRNNLISSLWSLKIDDMYDNSWFEIDEDEWLEKMDDGDGEIQFFGPNEAWKEEREWQTQEEEHDLPLSANEKFFLDVIPDYLRKNHTLLPRIHIGMIFDTETHWHILKKFLIRKSLIYIYAQNNSKRKKGNKKGQIKYEEHLEQLRDEIRSIQYQLENSD